ncbi:DUF1033 family protein [Bacillus coahuilensis]|uniref:DUF1033 family protein n=1 Tax=Bacillus coahuilensis TaxID=408580 RepID=UPI000750AB38|nr:DUF1033 family protein [Bacillus coahuilensis]
MEVYTVYELKGDYEPWWLFEDWQTQIQKEHQFLSLDEALAFYLQLASKMAGEFDHKKTKQWNAIAFWNSDDIEYCEACEDDILLYHGIMIMKDNRLFPISNPEDIQRLEKIIPTSI